MIYSGRDFGAIAGGCDTKTGSDLGFILKIGLVIHREGSVGVFWGLSTWRTNGDRIPIPEPLPMRVLAVVG